MSQKIAKISGIGGYLPPKIVTNEELCKTIESTDEWIFSRTGIKERHIVEEGITTTDLAYEAAKIALHNAGIKADELDGIVLATTTPDLTLPSTATLLQAKLGANKAWAFDVQAVCAGFIYALNIANNFIITNQAGHVLVIGADAMSKVIDWQDRGTAILFGDGAGAVVLSASEKTQQKEGIIASNLHSNGELNTILNTTGGTSRNKQAGILTMQGKEVFKHAVEKMSSSILEACKQAGVSQEEISLIVPHQANQRIINAIAERLNFPIEKVFSTVDKHANTSAASIPLALFEAYKEDRLRKGDLLALTALGAGLVWGSCIISF